MKKVNPIAIKLAEELEQKRKDIDLLQKDIDDRVEYILKFLAKQFGEELDYWCYDDNDRPFSPKDECFSYLDFSFKKRYPENAKSLLKTGEFTFFDYSDKSPGIFPTRFLFEDFEQEVIDGIKELKKREAEKDLKDLENKKTRKSLAEQAKKKLTSKELAALKKELEK